jgi:hypothetical protein
MQQPQRPKTSQDQQIASQIVKNVLSQRINIFSKVKNVKNKHWSVPVKKN